MKEVLEKQRRAQDCHKRGPMGVPRCRTTLLNLEYYRNRKNTQSGPRLSQDGSHSVPRYRTTVINSAVVVSHTLCLESLMYNHVFHVCSYKHHQHHLFLFLICIYLILKNVFSVIYKYSLARSKHFARQIFSDLYNLVPWFVILTHLFKQIS